MYFQNHIIVKFLFFALCSGSPSFVSSATALEAFLFSHWANFAASL
jgi:hypothetical protein